MRIKISKKKLKNLLIFVIKAIGTALITVAINKIFNR